MRLRTKIAIWAVVLAAPFILGYAWWRHHYPYGWSHCCDTGLSMVLQNYAVTHGGAFPAGEATPEASLSLLYREKTGEERLADANLLRGKTVPESVVKEVLERGELLTPDTCGWHYVEGMRMDDDPRLALFWDKVGLNHNGGLLDGGGHTVWLVNGVSEYIPESEWDEFIAEQNKLLSERKTAIHHDATLRTENGLIKVQVRVIADAIYGFDPHIGNGGGCTSHSAPAIATLKKAEQGMQGFPVIPIEEIKNAKVVVEQEKSRVRFVMKDQEIIYDKSGFRVEATANEAQKK